MLRPTAALLTSGAVGAGLASGIAEKAQAAETQFTVAGDEVTVRNGEVAALWLDLAIEWAYAVPSGERPQTLVCATTVQSDSEPSIVEI